MFELTTPDRPLNSIVLPGDLRPQIELLLQEWEQSEKLLRYGISPRNRVLLYGPPGNGKTTLAAAIATEMKMQLGVVNYGQLIGKYVGFTGANLESLFNEMDDEKCVLFFDEIDSIGSARSDCPDSGGKESNTIVTHLLMKLDRFPAESVIIFATNLVDSLDPALRRRVNMTLEMPAPSRADLKRHFKVIKKKNPRWPLDDFDLEKCQAKNFAEMENKVTDHARMRILTMPPEPAEPRSAWMQKQLAERSKERQPMLAMSE